MDEIVVPNSQAEQDLKNRKKEISIMGWDKLIIAVVVVAIIWATIIPSQNQVRVNVELSNVASYGEAVTKIAGSGVVVEKVPLLSIFGRKENQGIYFLRLDGKATSTDSGIAQSIKGDKTNVGVGYYSFVVPYYEKSKYEMDVMLYKYKTNAWDLIDAEHIVYESG